MKRDEERYTQFALVREMLQTPDIVRNFTLKDVEEPIRDIKETQKLFFTGEGSSRIFPAKNTIAYAMRKGLDISFATEGGRQSAEYNLSRWTIFAASNSGRTKEIIALCTKLRNSGHSRIYGLTANTDTPLEKVAKKAYTLTCGKEDAVAATKSVIEQGLFYQSLIAKIEGADIADDDLAKLADALENVLTTNIDNEIINKIANAGVIYFAGRNDGVAEELTLKTNEITRKKSDYLEGTYAVHGIEEVMDANDVVIVIDPFKEELDKFKEVLVDGVGLSVYTISTEDTIFPTIKIPDLDKLNTYLYLAMGWNLLVEVGIKLGINLDKPERARKVGNELIEGA